MKTLKLGDYITEINEKTSENNQYPVLTSSKRGLYLQQDYFNKQVASKNNKGYKIVKYGEFTYRSMSDTGEFFINRLTCCDKGIVSPAYPVFKINENVNLKGEYLQYYFKTKRFQQSISLLSQGSTRTSIKLNKLKDVVIPITTAKQQNKIVEVLDKAKELIDKRKAQIEDLDELVKSRFIEMFGDPLINNKGFSKIKIKDVIDTKILKASKVYKGDEQISYIDISCIDNLSNKIISHNEYLFREAPSRAQQCIEKDDILISTVRPNLRNVAMVEDVFENMVATSGVTVLRSNKINKYFLYKYVLSEYFTNEMVAVTSGANYPAIKSSDIYNHEIIYPPIEMQNEFAKFFKRVDKLKFEMEQSLKELEDNFNSLMQRAFKGELFN